MEVSALFGPLLEKKKASRFIHFFLQAVMLRHGDRLFVLDNSYRKLRCMPIIFLLLFSLQNISDNYLYPSPGV